jgi:hypothetical protein
MRGRREFGFPEITGSRAVGSSVLPSLLQLPLPTEIVPSEVNGVLCERVQRRRCKGGDGGNDTHDFYITVVQI